jgi:hypothetical protein
MATDDLLRAVCFHTDAVVLARAPPELHAGVRACALAAVRAHEDGGAPFHMRAALAAWGADRGRVRACFELLVRGGMFSKADERAEEAEAAGGGKRPRAPAPAAGRDRTTYALKVDVERARAGWPAAAAATEAYADWADAGDARCPNPACEACMRVPVDPKGPFGGDGDGEEQHCLCAQCDARLAHASRAAAAEVRRARAEFSALLDALVRRGKS